MIKVQSFPALRMALVGESGDEAATPLSFPHIKQDEANQAKFSRKEPWWDGLTLPALCLARLQAVHCHQWGLSSRLHMKGPDGPEYFSEPLLKQGLVQSSNSEPTSGKWRLLLPENVRTGKKKRRNRENEEEEGKERNKGKREKSGRVKEGEGPLNVTSPALWNGFSLMLTTWYLLSI